MSNEYTNIRVKQDIGLRWITMPDGMPHLEIDKFPDDRVIEIDARLKTGEDVFRLLALCDICLENGIYYAITFRYVSAGRMDRSVRKYSPCMLREFALTLQEVVQYALGIRHVCAHSQTILDLIRSANQFHENGEFFFLRSILEFKNKYDGDFTLVLPDLGAVKRFESMSKLNLFNFNKVYCEKVREESTGKLKGFKILAGTPTENCLIVDDLCDGGGTFKGQAQVLREAGAKVVGLAVVHGIFSKGTLKPDIDWVSCTNSFDDEYNPFIVDEVVKF